MDFVRPLGGTGIRVSAIGLGTVKVGRNTGVKYPAAFSLPSDEQVAGLLRAAADLGVNLIDTAPAYGVSESRLGECFARHNWFGSRERWVVATKAGEEFEDGESRFDFSGRAIEASVMRSLERLRTDYLDVVLIHSDGRDEAIVGNSGGGTAIGALQSLKARGVIRAIGISIKSAAGGYAALGVGGPVEVSSGRDSGVLPPRRSSWCDVLMCTLNESYVDELPLIRLAHSLGVGVLVKKALQSGHVAEKKHSGKMHAAGVDSASKALKFVERRAGAAASSIIVGTLSAEHFRQNVAAVRA